MRLALSVAAALVLACASPTPRPAAATAAEAVQYAAVDGTRIAYVVEGDGPPLVIVHGAWGDYRSFHRAAPVLATRHKVIRVSLRQHWPNAPPSSSQEAIATYSIDRHVADVAALIRSLRAGKVDLLGHSHGGLIAAAVAQRHPALIRRLVLVEPSLVAILRDQPDGPKMLADGAKWRDEKLALVRGGHTAEAVVRGFYDDTPGLYDSFPEIRRRTLIDNARTTEPFLVNFWSDFLFTCDDAKRIRLPVLLVEGEKTGQTIRDVHARLSACLPDSKRVVLAGASHLIQWDAPEAMASSVAAFLSE